MSDKKYTPSEAALMVLAKAQELFKSSNLSKCGTFTKVHNKAKEEGYSEESADKIAGHAKAVEKSEKPLAKKYEGFEKVKESAAKSGASDPAAVAAAVGMKKYGKKNFEEHAHEGKKLKKDESMASDMPMGMSEKNPDEKADADLGEEVEKDVEQHEKSNEDPKHEMKGHIKLAKFMGAMEAKRGKRPGMKEMDKAETGHEKGINLTAQPKSGVQPGLAGKSMVGLTVRHKGDPYADSPKEQHKKVLGEMKSMPKPKLPG